MENTIIMVTCTRDIDELALVRLFNYLKRNKIPLELRKYAISVYQQKSQDFYTEF